MIPKSLKIWNLIFLTQYFNIFIFILLSGDDCEEDFNACLYNPCAEGQECIDYNVTYHKLKGKSYECTNCPDGFAKVEEKCQGKTF